MRRTHHLMLAALVSAGSWYVLAGDQATDAPAIASHSQAAEAEFGTLDTNADHMIDRSEAQAWESLQDHFDELDENNDGALTESEFSAFEQAHRPHNLHGSDTNPRSAAGEIRSHHSYREGDEVIRGREPR